MLYLGLGSNLGEREENLESAISLISQNIMAVTKRSGVMETEPLLSPNPEPDWHKMNYLNMVIGGIPHKNFEPEEVLAEVKKIETELGRKPAATWAPRIIDIDILAWGDLKYESATLTIPHKELLKRDFALKPLLEIAPEWVHP